MIKLCTIYSANPLNFKKEPKESVSARFVFINNRTDVFFPNALKQRRY